MGSAPGNKPVSEGVRTGQREEVNSDAPQLVPWTAVVLDGPAESSQTRARGQVFIS